MVLASGSRVKGIVKTFRHRFGIFRRQMYGHDAIFTDTDLNIQCYDISFLHHSPISPTQPI